MQTQQAKIIFKAVVVVLAGILIAANLNVLTTHVRLSFFGIGGAVDVPNIWLLLTSFVLGAIVWPLIWRGILRRKQ